jgi:hypothetical protein
MNIVSRAVTSRSARLLAVLSVACFWLLPLSPFVAIGAVSMTAGASDWSRKAAVAGAALCSAYTIALALLIVAIYLRLA